jgi:hypothetical protein
MTYMQVSLDKRRCASCLSRGGLNFVRAIVAKDSRVDAVSIASGSKIWICANP